MERAYVRGGLAATCGVSVVVALIACGSSGSTTSAPPIDAAVADDLSIVEDGGGLDGGPSGADAASADAGGDAANEAAPPITGLLACPTAPSAAPPCATSLDQLSCGGACVEVESDPANCGGCGRACADGGACSGGCADGELLVDGTPFESFMFDGRALYLAGRPNPDPNVGALTIRRVVPGVDAGASITYSGTAFNCNSWNKDGVICQGSSNGDGVMFIPKDGADGGVPTLGGHFSYVHAYADDVAIYVGDITSKSIVAVPRDGGPSRTVAPLALNAGFAVAGNRIFWNQEDEAGRHLIMAVDKSGGTPTTVAQGNIFLFAGDDQGVYGVGANDGSYVGVVRLSAAGNACEAVAWANGGVFLIAVDGGVLGGNDRLQLFPYEGKPFVQYLTSGSANFPDNLVLFGVVGVCEGVIFTTPIVHFFSHSDAVRAAATVPMRIMGIVTPIIAVAMILSEALFGAGNTKFVAGAQGLLIFGCLVPMAWVLGIVFHIGLNGIFASACLYATLAAVTMSLKFRGGSWRSIKL